MQLIEELEMVLSRPAFRDRLGDEAIARFILGLVAIAELVDDPPPPKTQICRDPDDDYLISLAHAAGVDALVSGYRDVLVLDEPKHPICTPAIFLAKIGETGDA